MNLNFLMHCRRLLSITLIFASTLVPSAFAVDASALKPWIEAQGELKSLTGAFTQERKLKVLRKTLVAPGRFWYRAPNQFRWDIGEPVRSVAIQSAEIFTMIDVEKGKAEVNAGESETNRLTAYLQMSFPRDWNSFQRQFRVLSIERDGKALRVELEPLDPGSARGVRAVRFEIDAESYATQAFVLDLKDGSEMRTSFSGVQRDVPVPRSVFDVSLEGLRVKGKGI
jgi:outer membrane lipoprotein-sorting protein